MRRRSSSRGFEAHGFLFCFFVAALSWFGSLRDAAAQIQTDILFVTQVPTPADVNNVASTFGSQPAAVGAAPRGGDLYIRYADGSLKNLTAAAGFGNAGLQGASSIAVRDPCVHWSGLKAIFSMVVGAPARFGGTTYFWQLYEITGLGKNETPEITRIARQPADYNNIMPAYGSDDSILFVSDRPRDGSRNLYPQLDESFSFPAVSGLWKLNPGSGALVLLDHSPSGTFHPIVDSFGRVLMTRWDHLERDALGDDTDRNGAFNYSGETTRSARLHSRLELFPEPRSSQQTLPNLNLHDFNQFTPWQINQDGTGLETINHAGRHELRASFKKSYTNDPNLADFSVSPQAANQQRITNFFQIREDPLTPGLLYGVDASELQAHSSGQLISVLAPPGLPADRMVINYLTSKETSILTETPSAGNTGHYRDPLPLSTGEVIASHSAETGGDSNVGTPAAPISRYDFRLKVVGPSGEFWAPQQSLTPGIVKQVAYYDPSSLVTYSGPLWELQPVEVIAKAVPPIPQEPLESPENQAFTEAGVDVAAFKSYLLTNNLALFVSRNVTTRDVADEQQPYNLRVAGTATQTVGLSPGDASGKIYDVSHLQIFQGDLIRSYGGTKHPVPGRRVLAQPLHDPSVKNPPAPGAPPGSVPIASDGSIAALVPASRALTWQLIAPSSRPIVHERYWLTAQAGEIRVCTSCHGLNETDQAGHTEPTNTPEALKLLLEYWKQEVTTAPRFRLAFTLASGAGSSSVIKIQGLNAAAASQAIDIHLAIGKISCGVIAHGFTAGNGVLAFRGRLPAVKHGALLSLKLEAASNDHVVARSQIRIRVAAATSAEKLCRIFGEFH